MKLLFVCTYNLVRSPVADAAVTEWALRNEQRGVTAFSAGVKANKGEPVPREVTWAAATHDLTLRNHRSQPLTPDLVRSSQLVVTMTEQHRSVVNLLAPQAFSRTFTLRELIRLTDDIGGPVDISTLAEMAHRNRPYRAGAEEPEDVVDIQDRSPKAFQSVVDTVVALTLTLTERLKAPRT